MSATTTAKKTVVITTPHLRGIVWQPTLGMAMADRARVHRIYLA